MRYRFAVQDKLRSSGGSVSESFEDAASRTVKALALEILDGARPSRREFRNRFGSLWYSDMKRQEFLFSDFSQVKRLGVQAVKVLDALYDRMTDIKGSLVAGWMPFEVTTKPNETFEITGQFPLVVASVPFQGFELYYFRNTPLRGSISASMDYVAYALSYAFRCVYGKTERCVVRVDIMTGSMDVVRPTRVHYGRLLALLHLMAAAQKTGFAPFPSEACGKCGYRKICQI